MMGGPELSTNQNPRLPDIGTRAVLYSEVRVYACDWCCEVYLKKNRYKTKKRRYIVLSNFL